MNKNKTKFYLFGIFIFFCTALFSEQDDTLEDLNDNLFVFTKKIEFKAFPNAYNPSIIKIDDGFLFSFRYSLEHPKLWINEIVVVILNDSLEPISEPQIINLRTDDSYCPFQEDARLFRYNDRIFVLYADFTDCKYPLDKNFNPFVSCKEEMHLVELHIENDQITWDKPIKLIYKDKYYSQRRQKNWSPFEWNEQLFFSYYLFPHEIIKPDLITGDCIRNSFVNSFFKWRWGEVRGGTPALLIDGEYLAFFHSSTDWINAESKNMKRHYFMGAYTFSPEPPFKIKKISPSPLMAKGMYSDSHYGFCVIFPGGYTAIGDDIYLAYGRNDCEMWIAKMSKPELMKNLVSLIN